MAPSEAAPAALWEELLRPGAAALLEALAGIPEPDANLLMVAALATLGVVRRWRREEGEGTA